MMWSIWFREVSLRGIAWENQAVMETSMSCFSKISDNIEKMTNRFPHIPDFAWISQALPLKITAYDFWGWDQYLFGLTMYLVWTFIILAGMLWFACFTYWLGYVLDWHYGDIYLMDCRVERHLYYWYVTVLKKKKKNIYSLKKICPSPQTESLNLSNYPSQK